MVNVCIGDSITAGVEKKEFHWIEILNRESETSYINKGICGDTTGGMLSRFYRDVIEEGARSVLIMGGSNDLIMGETLGNIRSNLMAMVHQAWHYRLFPVVGIAPFPSIENLREDWKNFTDFEIVTARCREQQQWLHQFGKVFHTDIIDFQAAFEQQGGVRQAYFIDGLHPNEQGNRIMAEWVMRHQIKV